MIHEEYYEHSLGLLADIVGIAESIRASIGAEESVADQPTVGLPTGSEVKSSVDSEKSIDSLTALSESIKGGESSYAGFNTMIGGVIDRFNNIDEDSMTNLLGLGAGIKQLGISLAIFAPLALIASPAILTAMPILMLGLLPLTNVMKKVMSVAGDSNTEAGGKALKTMGLSLLWLSGSLLLSSIALSAINWAGLAVGLPLIGLMAFEWSVIGAASRSINKGSLAVMGIGASMLLMTPGMFLMQAAISADPNIIWQLPLMVGELATVYGIAGMVAPYILMGSLAVAAMGASLWVIGAAVKKFSEVSVATDPKLLGETISSVISGMVRGVSSVSLKDALTIPLKLPAVILMSGALLGIATSVKAYKTDMPEWNESDSMTLERSITSMSKAFAVAGSSDGMSSVFGFKVGKNDVERGIDSTARMGRTLASMTIGIKAWNSMTLDSSEVSEISDKMMMILNVIPANFAVIGKRERDSREGSFMFAGLEFSNPFAKGDVELGISSVKRLGGVLTGLSSGIKSWKTSDVSHEDVKLIGDNISKVLNVIPFIFASIGQRERGTQSDFQFFGMSFTNPFAKGDVELGISSVRNLGDTLSDLYDGISVWGSGKIDPELIKTISSNIDSFLLSIPASFAKVGRMESDTEGFIWGDGDVNKGIDSIKMLLPLLTDMTKVVKSISEDGFDSSLLPALGSDMVAMTTNLSGNDTNLDDLIDPYTKFVKQFGKFVGFHSKYMKSVNSTSQDKLETNIEWVNSLNSLGDLNPSYVRSNLEGFKDAYSSGYLVPNGDATNRFSELANRSPSQSSPFSFFTNDTAKSGQNDTAVVNKTTADGKSKVEPKDGGDREMLVSMIRMMDERFMMMADQIKELTEHMKTGIIRVNEVDGDSLFD